MPYGAIEGVQGTTGTSALSGLQSTRGSTDPDGAGFAAALTGAVDNLQATQSASNSLAIQAVTGDLDDIHTAMIAATRAQVTMELVAGIRNKGVDAFNDIMRMQA